MTANRTLYSRNGAPLTAAELGPFLQGGVCTQHGDRWTVQWPGVRLAMNVMPESERRNHLAGFARWARAIGGASDDTVARIGETKLVLGCVIEPDIDERSATMLVQLASAREALVFLGDEVVDEAGKCVARAGRAPSASDEEEEEEEDDDDEEEESEDEEDDEEEELTPPDAERVARRAVVLFAVSLRGTLEWESDRARARALREKLVATIEGNDLGAELEESEREALEADVGSLGERPAVDASWKAEGAAVLAWALSKLELPRHDTMVRHVDLAAALGFELGAPIVALGSPVVRSEEELAWMLGRLLGIHWRVREHSLQSKHVDFAKFAGKNWFGGFDASNIPLAEGDLAIDGAAIAKASTEAVQRASSIAFERHRAINWLVGMDETYSEVDTAT